MKRLISSIVLLLVATFVIVGVRIQPAKASGTIYIRADGSIDPPTTPIERDGYIYAFTENIYNSIVVERDHIVLDGQNYSLQGDWTDESKGLDLAERENVTIRNFEIRQFCFGILLINSTNNSILNNNITAHNQVPFHSVQEGGHGIRLIDSANNSISGNGIEDNWFGIRLINSKNNSILGNYIANNDEGIQLYESSNNNIFGNNITANTWDGIQLYQSSNNVILNNNITANNQSGIRFYWSYDNSVIGNTIAANTLEGFLFRYSSGNIIYHNNLIGNIPLVLSYGNFLDNGYPSGGNYWSSYNCTDFYSGAYQNETGSDGIADMPYPPYGIRDNYPCASPISFFDAGTWDDVKYYVILASNSTISAFHFDPSETVKYFSLDVDGLSDTEGFCRIAFAEALLYGPYIVTIDDAQLIPTGEISNDTVYLYFTYNHSIRTVKVIGTEAIPEFPSPFILPLFMIATLLAVIVYKRKHQTRNKKREVYKQCSKELNEGKL